MLRLPRINAGTWTRICRYLGNRVRHQPRSLVDTSKISQRSYIELDERQVDDFKRESFESPKPVSQGMEDEIELIIQMGSFVNVIQCVVLDFEKKYMSIRLSFGLLTWCYGS